MNAKILAILLFLPLAAGAWAQPEAPVAGAGTDDPGISRECFDLALRIRRSGDPAERAVLTEALRGKVAERHAARLEAGKRRIAEAERAIAERHAAALRALDAVKQRVADAETHQAENIDREMEALLEGKLVPAAANPETPKGTAP